MITIKDESLQQKSLPINMDRMADRYKTDNDYYSFVSPTLWTIEKNLFFLLRNSTLEKFQPQYRFKPYNLSYDKYGTVVLSQLLMFVNNVACMEDFDLDTVVIPSYQAIVTICQDNFPEKDVVDLTSIAW